MEWISVKDRLPEIPQDVICINAKIKAFWACMYTHKGFKSVETGDIISTWDPEWITHWKPIEPPEES